MDVAGDNQLNVEHEMVKQRVSRHGVPIGAAGIEIIGEVKCKPCAHNKYMFFFLSLNHGM